MAGIVCQRKKKRRFDGKPLHRDLPQPYWQAVGFLAGDMKGLVVQYRRKYYATNRLSVPAKEGLQHYKICHAGEEVIRTGKSQRSLDACQAGYRLSENSPQIPRCGVRRGDEA